MKTVVYIDGYNLYYGAIKQSRLEISEGRQACKWLDVVSLSEMIVNRNSQVDAKGFSVKYFSAPVKAKYSEHGQDSFSAQHAYHRALKSLYPTKFELILGKHQEREVSRYALSEPFDLSKKVDVLEIEEKQTDVNIALQMLRDAYSGTVNQQVLITSDSDLEPAMKMIKEDFPDMILGLVLPVRNVRQERAASLIDLSDWRENHLRVPELEQHQLPDLIEIGRHIRKPERW